MSGTARKFRCGISLFIGRGWVLHLSTEDGFQFERAEHRTFRIGAVFAWRAR